MNIVSKGKRKCFWYRQDFWLTVVMGTALLLPFGKVCIGAESEGVQHYKMLSSVEYTGKSQFRNHAETLFAVRKQSLSDGKVQYCISTNDFELVGRDQGPDQKSSFNELSFVIDRKTRGISGSGKDLALLEVVNNWCVRSLKEVTKENIGKTWKQSFSLPFLDYWLLPGKLKFTLTAMQAETKAFGKMIAVRALSEPFVIKAAKEGKGAGSVKCRMNAVYLFDPEIEDIYMSISVFEATTTMNGSKERLRHEVATFKTDATGVPVDLNGLGKKFEKFARKVGLTRKTLKVVKESALPRWARSEGIRAAQATNICAGIACEGALNPVATVCMPAAHTLALQSAGKLVTAEQMGTISRSLVKAIPGMGGMKIAVAPAFTGVGLGTTGAIAGGTAGAIAIAGGGDSRSPSTP